MQIKHCLNNRCFEINHNLETVPNTICLFVCLQVTPPRSTPQKSPAQQKTTPQSSTSTPKSTNHISRGDIANYSVSTEL